MSILLTSFSFVSSPDGTLPPPQRVYIYVYIYIYMCVYMCVYIYEYFF